MKISEIRVYQADLPLVEGRYTWSDGRYVDVFDSTVVELVCDDGQRGYGEVCPLGPFYLPAFGAGARAGIGELSTHLLGLDPTNLRHINDVMDVALLGHPSSSFSRGGAIHRSLVHSIFTSLAKTISLS